MQELCHTLMTMQPLFSFTTNWLKNFQEQHAGATLNIAGVGHSLGGSLGEVFAVSAKQIAEKMGIKVRLSIMTEGAPNIIDANSLETYNNIKGKGNTIQIAHVYDPVPRAAFWLKSTNDAEIKRANSLFMILMEQWYSLASIPIVQLSITNPQSKSLNHGTRI